MGLQGSVIMLQSLTEAAVSRSSSTPKLGKEAKFGTWGMQASGVCQVAKQAYRTGELYVAGL